MSTKPYLISIASKTPNYGRYLRTRKIVEPSAQVIEVVFRDEYPGHLRRWNYVPPRSLADPAVWVIFTDTEDVVFQAPFPNLDATGKEILVADEGVTHRESDFWKGFLEPYEDLRDALWNERVYNVGCFAMKAKHLADWIAFVKDNRSRFPGLSVAEQPLFNLWLKTRAPEIWGVHPYLFTTLYANLEKGNVMVIDRVFVNREEDPYCVVHANGNMKHMLTYD